MPEWTMDKLLIARYGKKEGMRRFKQMQKSFSSFIKENYSMLGWIARNKKKLVEVVE